MARTKMAIRKPITGPSRLASVPASPAEIAPAAIKMTAAGTAATASGQPRGLVTAQASTASRARTETVSPTAAFSVFLPGLGGNPHLTGVSGLLGLRRLG